MKLIIFLLLSFAFNQTYSQDYLNFTSRNNTLTKKQTTKIGVIGKPNTMFVNPNLQADLVKIVDLVKMDSILVLRLSTDDSSLRYNSIILCEEIDNLIFSCDEMTKASTLSEVNVQYTYKTSYNDELVLSKDSKNWQMIYRFKDIPSISVVLEISYFKDFKNIAPTFKEACVNF